MATFKPIGDGDGNGYGDGYGNGNGTVRSNAVRRPNQCSEFK